MQVTTTADPAEFMATAGDWLVREPVENNVLLVHALDPNGVPPGDREPVFATVTDAGAVVGTAFARSPYRMTISDMPAEAAVALAEHLAKEGEPVPGVNGPTGAATAFSARWTELTGQRVGNERAQWIMRCTETTRPVNPDGRPRLATEDDQDVVAEWFTAGMRDSGLSPEEILRRTQHMVGGQIANQRLIVWETSAGEAAGAAGWNPPLHGVVRPSGVFVSPNHRDGGIATLVLGEVVARALEDGADACVCTHFLKYESMLAVVEKVGFRRLVDVVEHIYE
ncbi:GNAT family N-acetyltransferase [Actinophytocola gossypii]|uniref:GNAT family N-acetyltransferase n=1 Tax=Actinophytocola gossypii TaxID=2812003 RepID=A0ABT2JEX1_9PSEU|nr:GNAT family N-acetyltransferase [Actinophytocola gossypii]MCT2585819.1 GNAT family N-acetyltransferase [Actinophytocola gossypii]